MNRREILTILSLVIGCILMSVLRLMVGHQSIGFSSHEVITELRWSHVIISAIVGASLGLSGALLQSLLRNPLASPDLLGISAGAGFAVTLVTLVSGGMIGAAAAAFPAFIGASIVLLCIWLLSRRGGGIDPITMILVGVMVSIILGAATMLLASLMPDRGFSVSRWMMGGIREDIDRGLMLIIGCVLICVLTWSQISAKALDAMALSEDEAQSTGVPIGRVRVGQLLGAGLLTATSIVLAGPIGFVGLVCPHLVRMISGPSHRSLLVGSTLAGMMLMIGADTLVRLVSTDAGRIPIGVITALIGGPMFLVMLNTQRRIRM